MLRIFTLSVFSLLFSLGPADSVAFCKWTDRDGVTHYAESCPEDVNASEVNIEAPPSQEQVDAAARRSGEMLDKTSAHKEQRQLEEKSEARQRQAGEEARIDNLEACAQARWNLEILKKQRPVYFDDQNQLQFNQSLYDQYYEGSRAYLDDQKRGVEIERYTQVEEQVCTADEADIRDRIKIYQDKSRETVCLHLERSLQRMQSLNTGIPTDEMREQAELMSTMCR